jgi:hypothetical protein
MNGVLKQIKIQILVIMAIGKLVFFSYLKRKLIARHQWFIPVILVTLEAEIRRMVQGQPGQIVCETPSPKITRVKWTRGVA